MKRIYFDESGNSGNNLLDSAQPLFCYLGLEDSNNTVINKFLSLKKEHKYSEQLETKGANLSKSQKGQKFLIALWNEFGDSAKFVLHDKKFALACKMFEYVYEPVFANVSTLFYQINFHKYIAISMYDLFSQNDSTAEQLFNGFYAFIKDKGQVSLSNHIISCNIMKTSPLFYFGEFCSQYKTEIASDIDFTDKADKYILDLTLTSLYNLLGCFSAGSPEPMEVHCDNSKPIANDMSFWEAFINNENIVYAPFFDSSFQLTFNITQKPILEDSKEVVQLQIADLLVSSIYQAYLHPDLNFSNDIKKLSARSFISSHSVSAMDIQMIFDEYEIDEFQKIIRLLAEPISKTEKIEKLSRISCRLKYYQEQRNQYIKDLIACSYKSNS